ncbi:NAD(P)-binding domain-containing protein [Streptomyces polyrhachis]|uniref:NAD(P)-binding domain-containing protein n=1 Tax=Streptomyces polyrhachis TaxID=1282885 RepID=A0ABW2GEX1_9ACTN
MTEIAFLGLGSMGLPMARRLLDAGHPLTVWNRTASRAEPLAAAGARVARTPAEAVAGAAVVVTMLADPAAVTAVLLDAAPALRPGAMVVEMSTIGPDAVHALAARLPAGTALVDAPVMGSTPRARAGELTILAGGGAVARVEPVLAALGTVVRCGPLGSGAALKLVNNTAVITALAAVAESLALAASLGVDREAAERSLAAGPLAGVMARAADTESRFALGLASKDLRLAHDAAGGLPLAAAAGERLRATAEAEGAAADLSAVVRRPRTAPPGRTTPRGEHPDPRTYRREAPVLKAIDNPTTVPAPAGAYSHVARLDTDPSRPHTLLFLSGQIALDEKGELVGLGDMTAQSRHVMELIARILRAHGAGLDDIVNIRTFLTDMDLLPEYGAVRAEYLKGDPPTSTTVEVARLFRPGALLEVEVVAAVG